MNDMNEQVAGLVEHLPPWATETIFLFENWQWLGLAALALVGVVVEVAVRFVLGVWVRRLLAKTEARRAKGAVAAFARPIGILAMALTWMALLPLLELRTGAHDALNFAATLVAAVAAVWAAYKLIDVVSEHLIALAETTDTKTDDILVPMVRRAAKIVVIAIGVVFVADNLDIDVTSMIAGLGIGGIALALAAKDTVENLFGSVTVLVDRPFQIGDWVTIGDLEGTVEKIGFRSTRIRTFYDSVISVPNARLVATAVDNLGLRQLRRFKCTLGVEYSTPPEKIEAFCEGIRELVRRHPYTYKEKYMVYFNGFGDFSLNILLYVFHETPDWATELRERHRLLVDIVRLARELEVEFAFPTQTLHLASTHEGAAPRSPSVEGDAFELGRRSAGGIIEALGREHAQPGVVFDAPDRIRPDR